MTPTLDGVRAKIDRAGEHLKALDAERRVFFDTEPKPYEIWTEFDPQAFAQALFAA